ncbi:MAG: ribonuclease HI [Leptolyngbyaceae cyanobacterium]|mgnify:CR=1 FL=1
MTLKDRLIQAINDLPEPLLAEALDLLTALKAKQLSASSKLPKQSSSGLPTIQSIYTDGACSGNPGPGGWGTVIYFEDGSVHELGGYEPRTTNNRMEMQAALAGLKFLIASQQTTPIELFTDSEYTKKGITQWIAGWKRRGWQTSAKKPVLNQDLWQQLDQANQAAATQAGQPVKWTYVRGHAGNVGNERCDDIARAFSLKRDIQLRQAPAAAQIGATL